MLMGAYDRHIDKEVARHRALLGLEALPELAPDAARFPAAKTVVDSVPVPKVLQQVSPRRPYPGEIQHRLEKQPITERRRAAARDSGWRGEAQFPPRSRP
jgi:hypothetical protein